MKKILFTLIIIVIVLICFLINNRFDSDKLKIVKRVGKYSISQKDIDLRKKVIQFYYPTRIINDDTALNQLVKFYTYAEILSNQGVVVTDQVLKKEEERISKNTKLPGRLRALQGIFKNKRDFYYLFVLPVYVERTLYFDYFLNHPTLHNQTLKYPKFFLKEVLKKPISFTKKTESHPMATLLFASLEKEGELLYDRHPQIRSTFHKIKIPLTTKTIKKKIEDINVVTDKRKWVKELFKMKTGQIYPNIILSDGNWLVFQSLGKDQLNSKYRSFQVAKFDRLDFKKWIDEQKRLIEIE